MRRVAFVGCMLSVAVVQAQVAPMGPSSVAEQPVPALAPPASEPLVARTEVYVDATVAKTYGTAHRTWYSGELVRVMFGLRVGPTDAGLKGLDLRFGLGGHVATRVGLEKGAEIETTYPIGTQLRIGVHATAEGGGSAGQSLFAYGGVARIGDVVSVRVEGFHASEGSYLMAGRPSPSTNGILVGAGLGGHPSRRYHWAAIGAALLFAAIIAAAAGGN